MVRSPVYWNIHLYRLAMNALYAGGYAERFGRITALLGSEVSSICEPCFGDTLIADWCRRHDIRWTGVDVNPRFCARARRQGHEVLEGDLLGVDLPVADVYVMAGSLYHFHDRLPALFDAVFGHTDRFLLSEPIRNLSSRSGALGWLARRGADPGAGDARFRFDPESLPRALRSEAERLGLTVRIVSRDRDLLAEIAAAGDAATDGG